MLAGDDRDDGDDARSALRWPLPPRARRLGASGRGGLARRAVREAARPHARVRLHRAAHLGARAAARHTGEHCRIPYRGPGATGLGKSIKSILHGRQIPIYIAAICLKSVFVNPCVGETTARAIEACEAAWGS
jgi:hypothetical protein